MMNTQYEIIDDRYSIFDGDKGSVYGILNNLANDGFTLVGLDIESAYFNGKVKTFVYHII